MAEKTQNKQALIAWSFYDFAISAFSAMVETFVLPAYFVKVIASSEKEGTELWGLGLAGSALFIALFSPLLGRFADYKGGTKRWLLGFTLITIVATAGFSTLHVGDVWLTLALFFIATSSAEFAYIFYNAQLAELAPPSKIGLWSGFGWGLGYIGGVLALACALLFDVQEAFLFTALWILVFAWPLFIFTPQVQRKPQPYSSLAFLKRYWRFFLARMLFIDGLVTLFSFGGIYAASTFNMPEKMILLFGICLNLSAGIGATFFAYFDDRLGSLLLMRVTLIALMITTALALLAETASPFWMASMLLGLFVGPLQAASRSYLAKLAPQELRNQMFGFFNTSGKATSFLGPLGVSLLLYLTGSLATGMGLILAFFGVGLILLYTLENP